MTSKKTAAKTPAKKTRPHGGKPGSARANQSAQYSKGELNPKAGMVPGHHTIKLFTGKGATGRSIAQITSANSGQDTVAILNDGSTHIASKVPCKIGQNWDEASKAADAARAAEQVKRAAQPKGPATLAKGAEKEVHSRKAAADSRKAAEPKAPAAKKTKADKAAEPKAAKNKQPSNGKVRTYKLGKRKDESKPDTFRRYMLTTIMAHKSTEEAKAAHAKSGKYPTHKLDFNWTAQQGYIIFTDK